MNYEKEYNKLVGKIKKAHLYAQTDSTRAVLEDIYPQLAESEDERIKKALIEVFKKKLERGFEWVEYGIPNRSVLDWLEKQKESLHIPETCKENVDSFTEDERIRKELIETINCMKEDHQVFLSEQQIERYLAYLEKQKEQKPLHWRRIEDATTKRTDDGCCVTSEKMLVKGWMDDEDYRIVDEGTMVNRDILCIPVRELDAKQKEQKPYTDFVIKPHKGDDNNPYDMRVSEAQEYAIKRGFGVPFNDGEVYVDERHMTQTIGNIIRWADEHPKEQKPWKVGANAYFTPEQKPADLSEMMVHKEPYIAPIPTPMVADEQKPAEWSEEDENVYKTIMDDFNGITPMSKAYKLKAAKWLKSILERCSLQPKQEWSEEDERIRKAILGFVNPDKGGTKYSSYADLVEWSNWLKSLRPSWKPSEEQMKALNETVNILAASPFLHQNDYLFNILNGLREELKKLLYL